MLPTKHWVQGSLEKLAMGSAFYQRSCIDCHHGTLNTSGQPAGCAVAGWQDRVAPQALLFVTFSTNMLNDSAMICIALSRYIAATRCIAVVCRIAVLGPDHISPAGLCQNSRAGSSGRRAWSSIDSQCSCQCPDSPFGNCI